MLAFEFVLHEIYRCACALPFLAICLIAGGVHLNRHRRKAVLRSELRGKDSVPFFVLLIPFFVLLIPCFVLLIADTIKAELAAVHSNIT